MKKPTSPAAFFPLYYFPPVPWFVAALQQEAVWLDLDQPYRKQQYSSRTIIKVANRVLPLTIPVGRRSAQAPLSAKEISFAEDWAGQHWRSLTMAYRNSPYFLYYEDKLAPLFTNPESTLVPHNVRCLQAVCALLQVEIPWATNAPGPDAADYRAAFDPRLRSLPPWFRPAPYPQVFPPFVAGLSILDLLFNLGPESAAYLQAAWQRP